MMRPKKTNQNIGNQQKMKKDSF